MKGTSLRVGTLCYATQQGLAVLAKSFYDAGVITDVVIVNHKSRELHTEWYPPGTPILYRRPFRGQIINDLFRRIDVLLCFETPFDWTLLPHATKYGVKTVLIPMHEWYPISPPYKFDHFINPSLLDQDYFPHGTFIPIPAPTEYKWSLRTTAKRFLHNSGNIGSRNHKGTAEVIAAIEHIKSPVELTIRSQNAGGLESLLDAYPNVRSDPRVTIETGDLDRSTLFDGFDVYVAPEKYNGLSLPLQESYASGLMVMTTDRYPTNTWLPKSPLIPVERTHKVQAARGHLEIEESIVNPAAVAAKIDEWYGENIEGCSLSGKRWAEDNSWDKLRPRYVEFLTQICR